MADIEYSDGPSADVPAVPSTIELLAAIDAVESRRQPRQWFIDNYVTDGVLYVTDEQYRAIQHTEDTRWWGFRERWWEPQDMTPKEDSIPVVIRE